MGDESRLLADMQDPSWAVRQRAAHLLRNVPGTAALAALTNALDDADAAVISEAAESLLHRGDPAAIEPLWVALNDPDRVDEVWSVVSHYRELAIARTLVERDEAQRKRET